MKPITVSSILPEIVVTPGSITITMRPVEALLFHSLLPRDLTDDDQDIDFIQPEPEPKPSCGNCRNSPYATYYPKCGLCAGPNSKLTRYEPL